MLNKRQVGILLEMYENSGTYFTADYFSKKFDAGLRTIQDDMKALKNELDSIGYATIKAQRSKGSYLHIESHDSFMDWINGLYLQHTVGQLSFPLERAIKIMFILLNRFRDISTYELEEKLYVSQATLSNDIKTVQNKLSKFNLKLHKNGNRIGIVGTEINKRLCLAENSMYLANMQGIYDDGGNFLDMQRILYLKDILIDSFTESQYLISDMDLKNTVLTLSILVNRVQKSFFIKRADFEVIEDIEKELQISISVFKKIKARFLCNIPEEEIRFFAVYLKGQEIFTNHDVISQEMEYFINESFSRIRDTYGIDFTNNISLRIAISLHCIPLVIRIKHNMQIQNDSLTEVKKNFPLGYDIAQFFTYLLLKRFLGDAKVSENEIALIAAHFYGSILEFQQKKKQTRVLVISTLKMSMTVLLRSVLMKWFSQDISKLEFLDTGKMTPELLDEYDVFLTTEKDSFYEKGIAMYINSFPSENDRKNIKLLLDGFSNLDDVMQIFQRELFFSLSHGEKQDILEILSEKAAAVYDLEGLYDAVLERENIGSTFFSKGIAMPHPLHAISSDTFIAACVVKNPVVWDDDGNAVNIIMMIHIGKNNPQSFQLWDYLSRILDDKRLVDEILSTPTYENFTRKIRTLLSARFSSAE